MKNLLTGFILMILPLCSNAIEDSVYFRNIVEIEIIDTNLMVILDDFYASFQVHDSQCVYMSITPLVSRNEGVSRKQIDSLFPITNFPGQYSTSTYSITLTIVDTCILYKSSPTYEKNIEKQFIGKYLNKTVFIRTKLNIHFPKTGKKIKVFKCKNVFYPRIYTIQRYLFRYRQQILKVRNDTLKDWW